MVVVEHEPLTVPQVETPVTTREVLHRAADLLEEFGWCQHEPFELEHGGGYVAFCAGGAVIKAQEDLGAHVFDVFSFSDDQLSRTLGVDLVQKWNDAPGRTKAEVVARLRHAAESA